MSTEASASTSSDVLSLRQRERVLDLKTDLRDLHRIRGDHLNTASARSSKNTSEGRNVTILIGQQVTEEIVARQLQRLHREHTN